MSNASDIVKGLKKEYGDSVATTGAVAYSNSTRIPTGVFPFDLASGGGFPLGKISIVWGNESSGKTNLVLKAIGRGQLLFPDKVAVLVDAEHGFDPQWAALLGVNLDRIIVVHPESAEQAANIMESFAYATDVFIVALDSIAALSTQNEINSDIEKAAVGGSSAIIGKLVRKLVVSFNKMTNKGVECPAVVCINQVRHKIGVMFGSPDIMPGGNALRFAASLIIRIYGKNKEDKKIHAVLPAYKETSITITKWKVPIISQAAVYDMLMVKNGSINPGSVYDWPTMKAYLTELDYLGKDGKAGWILFGEKYKTQEAARDSLYSDPVLLLQAQQQIILDCLSKDEVVGANAVGDDGVEL